MRLQLDLLNEVRATAEQKSTHYQNLMAKYYNSTVRHMDFQVGDLVLRKVMGACRDLTQGKLGSNWEGTYRIMSWQRKDTYYLETLDGQKLPHPWNTEHLRKYYQQRATFDRFSVYSNFASLISLLQHSLVFYFTIQMVHFLYNAF